MTDVEVVKNFIYDTNVHKILSDLNNSVMDFNILEIVGMGTQEIKHSNILAWMFGDNEHQLGYKILLDFLLYVSEENVNTDNYELLKEYILLSENEKNIKIYREKDNIDLLMVDDSNKFVIAIENKLHHLETKDQLQTYENKVNSKYKNYNKIFIFLTIFLEEPSRNNWLKADYEMIVKSIQKILTTKNISDKTKIILSSYTDLLKRRSIVENKEIKELCEKIWLDKNYKNALEILIANKTTKINLIYDKLTSLLEDEDIDILGTYLGLNSIKELYQRFGKIWEEEENKENFIIEIKLEYKQNHIKLGYYQPNIENLDENIKNIYQELTGLNKLKKYISIKEEKESELEAEDIDIDAIAHKFLKTIKETDKKIAKVTQKYLTH